MAESIQIAGISKPKTQENALVCKSIEGYVIIVTNLHPETSEDSLYDAFDEFARISKLHLNLDRHTGFAKGYAFIEFETLEDAKEIMKIHHNEEKFKILGNTLDIDYAFVDTQDKEYRSKHNTDSEGSRVRLGRNSKRDLSPGRL